MVENLSITRRFAHPIDCQRKGCRFADFVDHPDLQA